MQPWSNKSPESGESTQLENGNTLYVHLCSGRIVEVFPTTAVRVTSHEVIALDGCEVAATFARADVYFASNENMESPPMD